MAARVAWWTSPAGPGGSPTRPVRVTYQAGPGAETPDAAGNTGGAVINGGIDPSGHDLLIGGSGNDSLFAGNSADTFTGGERQ